MDRIHSRPDIGLLLHEPAAVTVDSASGITNDTRESMGEL